MSVVNIGTITSADWSPEVGAIGQIVENLADIAQAINILLQSPKGSDPHRPTFGCDAWQYLDAPTDTSAPNIIREATDAIALWEPRATLTSITCQINNSTVVLSLQWTATLGNTQTQEVVYVLTNAS
jgi:hypothetical protein